MNKLSKEKKSHLALVTLVVVAVAAGLWLGLLSPQKKNIQSINTKVKELEGKVHQVESAIKSADRIEAQLSDAAARLDDLEKEMASGDLYSWMINLMRQFKLPHKAVDIPQFSQIVEGEMTMLPRFPYRQVTLGMGGTACYHDLGNFIADFENRFPHMRIQNLDIEPASSVSADEKERLSFKMNVIALVKPHAS